LRKNTRIGLVPLSNVKGESLAHLLRKVCSWAALAPLGVFMALVAAAPERARAEEHPISPWSTPEELRNFPVVREIDVRGLDTLSTPTILGKLETQVGRPFDLEAFRRDMDTLAAIGPLEVIRQAARYELLDGGSAIRVVLELRENPRVRKIVIAGNVRVEEKKLRPLIMQKEGEILQTRSEDNIRRAIQKFYSDGGYHQTRVIVRRIETGQPREVDLAVYIDEGERIRIGTLILRGNRSFPGLWIKPRLINHGSWWFFHNYFDEELFQTDLETVRAFYVDHGFLEVKVRQGTPEAPPGKGRINPVIEIEEGRQFRVEAVEVRGHTLFTTDEVQRPFKRLIAKSYDGDRLRKALDDLREIYGNEGYIDLETDVRTEIQSEKGTVRLVVSLKEGELIYVGDVKVDIREFKLEEKPNWIERFTMWIAPKTKDDTVRREVRLKPGQTYRRFEEVRTEERLRRLNIFEKVNIRREPTEDPRVHNAVIEAEEAPEAGYLTAMVGYGDVTGPAVTVGLVAPNIGGEANVFRASATVGRETRRYGVRYFERYLGSSDTSLETALYRNEDRFVGYRQRLYGASTEAGKPLGEYLKLYLRLRLEDVKFTHRKASRHEPLKPYQTVAVRTMLDYDRRDSDRWPTRGFRVAGGVEGGYADGTLVKFLHSFGYYKTVTGDLIYAYEHDFGLLPYRASRVGITERFFMGGTNDLRGFSYRGAGPVDSGYKRLRVGGSTKFVQRNEMRFPIFGALKGRVFLDDGFLDAKPFNFRNPRASTGAGFLMDLRLLQVEVDFARAILRERTDSQRLIHFRIASGF